MTRDTKIGLLVGLAFIIMIGILLSDHLTSTTEPQQAQLAQAGDNVRSGVTTPGAANNNPNGAATAPTAPVTPQQQVPTNQELTPRQPPVEIVQIGGGGPPVTAPQTENPPVGQGEAPGRAVADTTAPPSTPITRPADPNIPGSLANIARDMGEELVTQDGTPVSDPPITTVRTASETLLPAGAKNYKAQPGDSVSRMASRLMGGNTKANRDAIIAANPSLQQNANMVIVGRSYVIPAASGAATAAPAPSPVTPVVPETPAPVVAENVPVPAAPEYFYTVKPGDSLTKICVTQLGSAAALAAVKDLNKDLLKGSDTIHPNMKLRLPAKPIASAQ